MTIKIKDKKEVKKETKVRKFVKGKAVKEPKALKKEKETVDNKGLKFFSLKSIEVRNDKRNLYFRFLRGYKPTLTEKVIPVKEIFGNKLEGSSKAGEDYFAKGLSTKVLYDLKVLYGEPKYKALRVREIGRSKDKIKEIVSVAINRI